MILLSDNDIIYKLAACDMLEEALVVLGVPYTDVYVLPTCQPITRRLSGHVIRLEQIVTRVIAHFGFSYVKDKVVPARACDAALRAAFGSGDAAISQMCF